ncbi:MAG: hypothetical protein WED82_05615, partial [Balneolales bacterium]
MFFIAIVAFVIGSGGDGRRPGDKDWNWRDASSGGCEMISKLVSNFTKAGFLLQSLHLRLAAGGYGRRPGDKDWNWRDASSGG